MPSPRLRATPPVKVRQQHLGEVGSTTDNPSKTKQKLAGGKHPGTETLFSF